MRMIRFLNFGVDDVRIGGQQILHWAEILKLQDKIWYKINQGTMAMVRVVVVVMMVVVMMMILIQVGRWG